MVRCPLTKVTEKVRSIPCWQSCWYRRRRLGLDQILFEQLWKQIRIFHGNWGKLCPRCLLSRLLLRIRLLRILLLRTLLELWLMLGDRVLAWINFWTTVLKAKHCSISWPGSPWWKAQERSALYPIGNLFGTGRGCLVWIRFSLSSVGSSSAYFTRIESNCGAPWAWFWAINCWKACCRGCCGHICWPCVTTSEDTKLVNFSTSSWSVVTSSRSSYMRVEVEWRHQTTSLMDWPFDRKTNVWDTDLKLWNAKWCMMLMQT